MPTPPIVLASASPRRRELLASLGLTFTVLPSPVDEATIPVDGLAAADMVQTLSLVKAQAVATDSPASLVIGADTVVVLDGHILGKPLNADHAIAMLKMLQGRQHTVYTGVTVMHGDQAETAVEATDVWMQPLSEAQIAAYVATGEPLDKAGAYAIQGIGSTLIPQIAGCYFNVVGLPLHRLSQMLQAINTDVMPELYPLRYLNNANG